MARYFFDTSALIKRYHAESGTPEVRRLITEPGAECVISRLATVEVLSGFAGKVAPGFFRLLPSRDSGANSWQMSGGASFGPSGFSMRITSLPAPLSVSTG